MNQNQTKEKIIQLASHELAQHSWQEFSLRPFLSQLNLTTGAFYKHFHDKNDLFKAVSQKFSMMIYQNVYPQMKTAPNPKLALLELGYQLLQYSEQQPYLVDFLFFNPGINYLYQQPHESLNTFPLYEMTKKIVAALISDNSQQEDFFIQIWAFIQGYGLLIRNRVVALDKTLFEKTLNQFLGEELCPNKY